MARSLTYLLARLTPCTASLLAAVSLAKLDAETTEVVVGALILLIFCLILWSMAESTVMLWIRAKRAGESSRKGYAIVSYMLGAVLLVLLQLFRVRSSQGALLMLLLAFSLRGLARTSWDQNRLASAIPATVASGTLLAFLSFFVLRIPIQWQMIVYCTGFGCATAAVDVGWFAPQIERAHFTRRTKAVLRFLIFAGPVAIATLAIAGQLPKEYVLVYAALPFAARAARRTSQDPLDTATLYEPVAGVYWAFLGIMLACRLFVMRSALGG